MVLNFSDNETQNATVEFINSAKMSIKATFKNLIRLVKGLTKQQRIEKQKTTA